MNNHIDVLCMQETEIERGYDDDLVQIPGYVLELENNELCASSKLCQNFRK